MYDVEYPEYYTVEQVGLLGGKKVLFALLDFESEFVTSSWIIDTEILDTRYYDGTFFSFQDYDSGPNVLLPTYDALADFSFWYAAYVQERYEEFLANHPLNPDPKPSFLSRLNPFFSLGSPRITYANYLISYIDDWNRGRVCGMCSEYKGKYYTDGDAAGKVVEHFEGVESDRHIVVPRGDDDALRRMIDKVHGWYGREYWYDRRLPPLQPFGR